MMNREIDIRAIAAVLVACALCAPHGTAAEGGEGVRTMILDFGPNEAPWRNIDDGVMGGLSASEMVVEDGVGVFRGEVSLDNNGGFASVRSLPQRHDLSEFDGLVVRVRGDGKRYRIRLRTDRSFDGVSYQAPLEPKGGEWHEVVIPFSAFEPVYRGRRVAEYPPLDRTNIQSFGLLIADRQVGSFRLEVDSIGGYRNEP